MNGYAAVIAGALLTGWFLDLVSRWCNLRGLRPELPRGMEGFLDGEAYARSQEYIRARTVSSMLRHSFELAALLLFWFSGGFNALDLLVRGHGAGVIMRGLLYAGLLLLLWTLLTLPFSLYETFVVEERFGFNRTKAMTFFLDRIKALLLGGLLGGPFLALLLAIFASAGAGAWLYCWAVASAWVLMVQFVAPAWIMPLFSSFTPLAEGALKEGIFDYARSVGFPLEKVFVVDGSRRSTKSNAFFTGFGRHKRIALFDTLLEGLSHPELLAVLAHEVGHYRLGHIAKGMALSIAHLGIMLFLLSLFMGHEGLYGAFLLDEASLYTGLLLGALLLTPLDLALSPLLHALSRRHEREADRFAAETTKRPAALIRSLKKLAATNLSNLTPHRFFVFLHHSHPPLLERVAALEALEP